jgi:FkbM family methyltransferase
MPARRSNQEARLFGLRYISAYLADLQRFGESDPEFLDQLLFQALVCRGTHKKRSQLGQDIFAIAMNGFARGGFFMEVGAHHSSQLSNSWLLEKEFGWSGILVEPNPVAHADLAAERSAKLVGKAAWHVSGRRLTFNAVADTALSTLKDIAPADQHDRSNFKAITVETITLDDILEQNGAPDVIHYISIDVEGAEIQVLDGLDIGKRDIRAFTIEFNHDKQRLRAYDDRLLAAGYLRVLESVSDFDAWYVKPPQYEEWRSRMALPEI